MKFAALLNNFRNDESGAVTVDWVVLTAAIVGLGLIVMNTVSGAITEVADEMASEIRGTQVGQPGGGDE